jgi:hypothetical protein
MRHTLTLEHTDIIEYATKLLALRGVQPAAPIVFRLRKGTKDEFEAVIDCVPADIPDHCPQCGSRLGQGPAISTEPMTVPAPLNVTALPTKPVAPTTVLDEALGESFDPPGVVESGARPSAPPVNVSDAEGMSALVAQSRRLEAQLERERKERKPK